MTPSMLRRAAVISGLALAVLTLSAPAFAQSNQSTGLGIRGHGVRLLTFNADALDADVRARILASAREELGAEGRIRLLLHSIAFGNLKPLVKPPPGRDRDAVIRRLAGELGVEATRMEPVLRNPVPMPVRRSSSSNSSPAYFARVVML